MGSTSPVRPDGQNVSQDANLGYKEYEYTELKPGNIRLLRFVAVSEVKWIADLQEYHTDEAPPYYALSYAWGDGVDKDILHCNGGVMHITTSLAEALSHIAAIVLTMPRESGNSPQHIWIDQICINQNDLRERGHQVQLMRSIYQEAARVFIWLGPHNEEVHGIADLLEQCNEVGKRMGWRGRKYLNNLRITEYDPAMWSCLLNLVNRPWFSRRWIVQEAALNAADPWIVVGEYVLSWYYFSGTVRWLQRAVLAGAEYTRIPHCLTFIDLARANRNPEGHFVPLRLDTLLTMAIGLETSVEHDAVFALLGVADTPTITPDYEQDLGTLFKHVALDTISRTQSLAMLAFAGSRSIMPGRKDCSPSWVPWRIIGGRTFAAGHHTPWRTSFSGPVDWKHTWNASGSASNHVIAFHDDLLHVRGLLIDSIEWISEPLDRDSNDTSFIHFWVPCFEKMLEHLKLRPSHEDERFRRFAFEFSSAISLSPSATPGAGYDETMTEFWTFWYGECEKHLPESRWAKGDIPHPRDGLNKSHDFVLHKPLHRLFVTQNGHVGSGTRSMQPEDHVYVLYGGAPLYILRPSGDNFEYIGGAYIQGFMQGEVIELRDQGVFQERPIIID